MAILIIYLFVVVARHTLAAVCSDEQTTKQEGRKGYQKYYRLFCATRIDKYTFVAAVCFSAIIITADAVSEAWLQARTQARHEEECAAATFRTSYHLHLFRQQR